MMLTTTMPMRCARRRDAAAFTLIEIMVAIGIVAIILAIGIPSLFRAAHEDSMRKVVADIQEACSHARARAVLDGRTAEIRIRPGERTLTVIANSAPTEAGATEAVMGDVQEVPASHREGYTADGGGGGTVFTMKFSDHIIIEFIGVNLLPDLQSREEVNAFFYANGTSDELVILLRSDSGEIRKITTDVVTGVPDIEVVK